jgi:hypothetical protein
MGTRKVIVGPHYNYDFKANADYEAMWDFLKNDDRKTIIAAQLTYLEFHGWLQANIRTSVAGDEKREELFLDVAEGFARTDLLLYGAICEAALFDAISLSFNIKGQMSDEKVKSCFTRIEPKRFILNNAEFKMQGPSNPKGRLALYWEKKVENESSCATFYGLIEAGNALKIYNESFKTRLHNLRKDRNTIHLSEQINRKKKNKYRFNASDRKRARQTTDDLRQALKGWYGANQTLTGDD